MVSEQESILVAVFSLAFGVPIALWARRYYISTVHKPLVAFLNKIKDKAAANLAQGKKKKKKGKKGGAKTAKIVAETAPNPV